MKKAYSDPSNVFYDKQTKTMYVSGTHEGLSDYLTDITIPFNMLSKTSRYSQAKQAFDMYLPETVIGDSMGGSIALQLLKDYSFMDFNVITYGAPVYDLHPNYKNQRIRHYNDPISMFDSGAKSSASSSWNAHNFRY